MAKFYKRKDWSGEEYYIDEKTKKEEDEAAAGCLLELGLWTPFVTLLYCFFSTACAQQIFDNFDWGPFVVLIVINGIYYFCLSIGSFTNLPKFELFLSLIAVGYFVYLFCYKPVYDPDPKLEFEWSIPISIITAAISVIFILYFFIRNR